MIYTIGYSSFAWSPLRYTALSCILGTGSAVVIVALATLTGSLSGPPIDVLTALRWEMGYMIVISGVLAIFSWNAGNQALMPINGILFINLVPLTTFVIALASGYAMTKPELIGGAITTAALISNNLYQRTILRQALARDVR